MSKNKKGVTLIELLVVISLGAILSSVAFFAYTGYTSDARDTKRKSDLNKVETVLQLYRNFKWAYPSVTDPVDITYSGATVWTQGVFGDLSQRITGKVFGDLEDPQHGNKYTYSTTANLKEYQIAARFEGETSLLQLFTQTPQIDVGIPQALANTDFSPLELSPTIWLDGYDIDGDGDTTDNPTNGANISWWNNKSSAGSTNDPTFSGWSIQYATSALDGGRPGVYLDDDTGMTLVNSDITSGDIFYVVRNIDPFFNSTDANGRWLQATEGNYIIGYHWSYRNVLYINGSPSHYNSSPARRNKRTKRTFIYGFHTDNINYGFYDVWGLISQWATRSISGRTWSFNRDGHAWQESSELVIGEILIFDNKLSIEDRYKVEWYLAHKWWQDDVLPDSHPFKDTPPESVGPPPPPDTTPDAFVIDDITDAELSTSYDSNIMTVQGINTETPISISSWGEYSIGWGAFISGSSTVSDGDNVIVRQNSSANNSTTTSVTLSIGGVSDDFSITTVAPAPPPDTTPDPFSFNSVSDAEIGVLYESNPITVTGINTPSSISVSGWQYSINGSDFTAEEGVIENNQQVTVRRVSAPEQTNLVSTTLTIWGVSSNYDITTKQVVSISIPPPALPTSDTYVVGDYNGLITHAQDGDTHYVFATPSIITYDTLDTDLLSIVENQKFVYNGFDNIPASYGNSSLELNGGFDFDIDSPVIYQWDRSTLGSYDGLKQVDNEVRSLYNDSIIYRDVARYLDDSSLWYLEEILGNSIGINPIKPYYCNDILQSELINNIAPLAAITASPSSFNNYGTWGIANGVTSTEGDLDFEYHSAERGAKVEFEWNTSQRIGFLRIFNRVGCCSDRLSGAIVRLYNDVWSVVYTHPLWDTSGDFIIDLDFAWIGQIHNVKKLEIEATSNNFINLREVEIFLGGGISSWVYRVDRDGAGWQSPYNVYCDMETDGGGWTRIGENYVSNGKFSEQSHIYEHTFSGYDSPSDNVIVGQSIKSPPSSIPSAYVLRHLWDASEWYELFFSEVPWEFLTQEVRLSAWVSGTSDSIFSYTIEYLDGTSESWTASFEVVDTDGDWERHLARVDLQSPVGSISWDIGNGIIGPFFITGVEMENYYR